MIDQHETEAEVVLVGDEYIVKLYANFGTMKMHVADIGPLATRELAEDLAEHMIMKEEGEEEVLH